ncbi:LOW QUALITY PROTEIN: hypothetical protein PFAG_00331 [Plasmodium falciparum Santa Lucia]|uniref:Uncharacterized protein n=2 Tax=Plasmodium falciparum TaxID=5833 RepID=W7FPX0_PLAFA|nr:LOW QUALITY PROTEIN: hypothetical protein PFNF135_00433 [Plasmodium falciparum NF135/5.C10]EUT92191.1 LOW QUALITY PROTEIN: hypothetical protein PFAG_00331 [Plasmodium falciparum Santa Lucia]
MKSHLDVYYLKKLKFFIIFLIYYVKNLLFIFFLTIGLKFLNINLFLNKRNNITFLKYHNKRRIFKFYSTYYNCSYFYFLNNYK